MESIKNRNGYRSTIACPPVKMASFSKEESMPAPLLGGNTDEIMKSLGYSDERIAALREDEAIK